MRLVTTLSREFVPGLAALLNSLVRNSGRADLDLTVITYGDIPQTDRDLLRSQGIDTEFVPAPALGTFEFDRQLSKIARMRPNFDKILMWRLPYQETCLYLDADILCLNPLVGIEKQPSLGVVVNQSQIGKPARCDAAIYRSRHWIWNAGVMFFRPSLEVFDAIQEYARSYRQAIRFGDQIVHNDFFSSQRPADVHYLDMAWNTSIWVKEKFPYLWHPESIKLLHYADGAKPFFGPPRMAWQQPLWELWEQYRVGRRVCPS